MLAPRLASPRAQMTRLSRILGVWFTYYVPESKRTLRVLYLHQVY